MSQTLLPIEPIDPADMIVDALAAALLPAREQTGNSAKDAIRLLNRAYEHPDGSKRKQRMTSFNGIALVVGQPPIVMASVAVDPSHDIRVRPPNNTSLAETIYQLAIQPPSAPTLVFLTQKQGAALKDMRVSYPSDVIWICRSGQAPTALSRSGYQQILHWHRTGVLKSVRAFMNLLKKRRSANSTTRIDADLDRLIGELNQPFDLYRSVRTINEETWAWANRKMALADHGLVMA